jgi:hypothetical protein
LNALKSEVQSLKSEVWSLKSEVWSPKSEVCSPFTASVRIKEPTQVTLLLYLLKADFQSSHNLVPRASALIARRSPGYEVDAEALGTNRWAICLRMREENQYGAYIRSVSWIYLVLKLIKLHFNERKLCNI